MPKEIEFEGRRIAVPDDATDDEIASILEAEVGGLTSTATAPPPVAPSRNSLIPPLTAAGEDRGPDIASPFDRPKPPRAEGPATGISPPEPRPFDRAGMERDKRIAGGREYRRALDLATRVDGMAPTEAMAMLGRRDGERPDRVAQYLRQKAGEFENAANVEEDVVRGVRGVESFLGPFGPERLRKAVVGGPASRDRAFYEEVAAFQRDEDGFWANFFTEGVPGAAGAASRMLGMAKAGVPTLGAAAIEGATGSPDDPLRGARDMTALVGLGGAGTRLLAPVGSGAARTAAAAVTAGTGAEVAVRGATGQEITAEGVAESALLNLGMAGPDIVRARRAGKAGAPPDLTLEEAGEVKARALQEGMAEPAEVISPERAASLKAAVDAGATPEQAAEIVRDLGATTRVDGNVAEGHRPTADVLADPAIPEAQKAAIRAANEQGVATASSHVDANGRGVAIGRDAEGNVRRIEAPKVQEEFRESSTPERPELQRLPPGTEPPVPEGHVRLYRGEGREVPEWERAYFPEMKGSEGRWFTDNRKVAEGYAREGDVRYLDVPKDVAEASRQRANAGEEGSEFLLREALTKYGPQKAEREAVRLGAGLGGASAKTVGQAADLPRNLLSVPGRLLDKPLSRSIDALGTLLGKGVRATAGRSEAVRGAADWFRRAVGSRRLAQLEFAKAKDKSEGTRVEGEGFIDRTADLTPEQRGAAFDYLGNMNDPFLRAKAEKALSPESLAVLREGRALIDKNEKRNAAEGLIGQEALRVHGAKEGEFGTHLRREYSTPLESEVLDHLLRLGGKRATIPPNELKRDKWIWKGKAKEYRKFDTEAEARAYRKEKGEGDLIAPLSAEARAAMGEVTDPGVVIARTIAMQDLQFNRAQALKAFAASEYASKTYRGGRDSPDPIPDDPRYGALRGMYVDKALRSEVVGRFGEREGIDTFFDIMEKATGFWKEGKTIYNPASQVRNALGNVAFSEGANVSPLRPTDYAFVRDAFRVLFARGGSPEHALKAEMARRGISRTTSVGADLEGALQAMAEVRGQTPKGLLRKGWNLIRQGPRETWTLLDNIPKAAAFLKEFRRTGSLDAAETLVRERFPDYSTSWAGLVTQSRSRGARLTKAVFAPPFVNFLSESVRIAAGHAKNRPASLATGLGVLSALALASKRAAGITDEEEKQLRAAAPAWMNSGTPATPWFFSRDEEGNAQVLDLRYVIPLSKEINDLTSGDDGRQSMLGIVNNPILAPLIDAGMNRERFFGGDIADKGASDAGAREAKLRYLFDAYAPSLLTKLTGFGRRPGATYRAMTGQKDRMGDVPDLTRSVLSDIGGVTLRPVDVKKETEKRLLDIKYRKAEHARAQNSAEKRGDTAEVERIQALIDALDRKAVELGGDTGIGKQPKRGTRGKR